jgi:two-component system, chemotaxis family, chemotaxis protein CheY
MAHILVIDDEPLVRLSLRRILERAGHVVSEACDGKEGFERFRIEFPDLVITDLIMPVCEGTETIVCIFREHPTAKIIAMSGGARVSPEEKLAKARELGVQCALTKPFDRNTILEAVNQCLAPLMVAS